MRTVKKQPKIHSGHIEVAVANLIGYRSHAIVPNVSWGLGLRHECDLLVLDSKNRFTEVEIKISAGDLKADFNKPHGHSSPIITRLVYALPYELYASHGEIIPNDCGVIVVKWWPSGRYVAFWERHCKHRKSTVKPDDKIIRKFFELGLMRVWSLKTKNNG